MGWGLGLGLGLGLVLVLRLIGDGECIIHEVIDGIIATPSDC